LEIQSIVTSTQTDLKLHAPSTPVLRIHLRWSFGVEPALRYLGDAWERSYGDLAWRNLEPERVLPWCFFCYDGRSLAACGVKTSPNAFCFWQVDPAGVSLWLDVRNGGRGVRLGDREIALASILVRSYPDVKPFRAAQMFYRALCEKPRLPSAPIYGGNNWYYAYGNSSADDIRADSERIASFASSPTNPPYMVIDDGWQMNPTAGPWSANNRFRDMAELARDMRRIGVQPGLWMRPLFTREEIPSAWRLASPNAKRTAAAEQSFTLDPSVPEVLEKVKTDIRTVRSWGYHLIKHDFSTYDVMGRWGNAMGATLADSNWSFANPALTTAEVITAFYASLRQAAEDAILIGCNTVGHLAAGWFEVQRTGDDTSGRDWDRTRRMGVNTLAFRGPQHGAFFVVDADCVGLTKQVPWEMNRQWLDLLARSGTALFVSAAPDAVGPEQRTAIREAFASGCRNQELGEPLDWMDNNEPEHWLLNGRKTAYDWFGANSSSANQA
jgi:alpha-galactosidase